MERNEVVKCVGSLLFVYGFSFLCLEFAKACYLSSSVSRKLEKIKIKRKIL